MVHHHHKKGSQSSSMENLVDREGLVDKDCLVEKRNFVEKDCLVDKENPVEKENFVVVVVEEEGLADIVGVEKFAVVSFERIAVVDKLVDKEKLAVVSLGKIVAVVVEQDIGWVYNYWIGSFAVYLRWRFGRLGSHSDYYELESYCYSCYCS